MTLVDSLIIGQSQFKLPDKRLPARNVPPWVAPKRCPPTKP